MMRLLSAALLAVVALWFPLAASAQTTINLSVTYTPGAVTRATNDGTTISAKVQAAVTAINAAYTSSGIAISLATVGIVPAGNTAPSDSASQAAQYAWVNNNPVSWQNRTNAEASISIHISDTSGTAGVMQSGTPAAYARDSTMAVPYSYIDTAMEQAIGRIFGMGSGYSNRVRSLPTDPLAGQDYCYHTRESGPSDPNASVLIPAYWVVYLPNGQPLQQSQSTTNTRACTAYRDYLVSLYGGGTTNYVSTRVSIGAGGSYVCEVLNNVGGSVASGADVFTPSAGSAPINGCPEITFNSLYSRNATMPGWPFLPLGDATHDNVSAMNAKVSWVKGYEGINATLLGQKRAGFFTPLWNFLF